MGTLGKKDLTARLREKNNIDNSIPSNQSIKEVAESKKKVETTVNTPKLKKDKVIANNSNQVYRTCFWVSDEIKSLLDVYAVQNDISIKDIIADIVVKIKKKEMSALSKKEMSFPEQKQINAFLSKEDKSFLKVLGINAGMSFKEILTRGIVKYLEDNQ